MEIFCPSRPISLSLIISLRGALALYFPSCLFRQPQLGPLALKIWEHAKDRLSIVSLGDPEGTEVSVKAYEVARWNELGVKK